jgi:hypothetical protein
MTMQPLLISLCYLLLSEVSPLKSRPAMLLPPHLRTVLPFLLGVGLRNAKPKSMADLAAPRLSSYPLCLCPGIKLQRGQPM